MILRGREGKDVLLEQDRSETSVEGSDTLVLQHLAEAADEAVGIGGLGNETDTGRLERAESYIGEELGDGSRRQVHGSAVVGSGLVSEVVDGLLLEQLITSELESALQEVTCGCWAEARQQRTGTLFRDHLAETTDQASVVCDGVELDSCLDAVGKVLADASYRAKRRFGDRS